MNLSEKGAVSRDDECFKASGDLDIRASAPLAQMVLQQAPNFLVLGPFEEATAIRCCSITSDKGHHDQPHSMHTGTVRVNGPLFVVISDQLVYRKSEQVVEVVCHISV